MLAAERVPQHHLPIHPSTCDKLIKGSPFKSMHSLGMSDHSLGLHSPLNIHNGQGLVKAACHNAGEIWNVLGIAHPVGVQFLLPVPPEPEHVFPLHIRVNIHAARIVLFHQAEQGHTATNVTKDKHLMSGLVRCCTVHGVHCVIQLRCTATHIPVDKVIELHGSREGCNSQLAGIRSEHKTGDPCSSINDGLVVRHVFHTPKTHSAIPSSCGIPLTNSASSRELCNLHHWAPVRQLHRDLVWHLRWMELQNSFTFAQIRCSLVLKQDV
mmetsp:Transcript_8958/g.25777  ORF Transcript_8958/g.25777 Transcript_8958/m.25777 type:complete len:268 (+) Transcript_8958:2171-2974(+)